MKTQEKVMYGPILISAIGMVFLFSLSTYAATYGGGSGTTANPYQIWTPEQMNTIGADANDWAKRFILMADIDMSAYTGTQYNIIGNSTIPFRGTFDGNGHVISNLTYETTAIFPYVGIFGNTSYATIKNTGIENANISSRGQFAGILVADQVYGTITNCYSTGSVVSSSLTNDCYVGGLVGRSLGDILSCYSTAVVSSSTASSTWGAHAGGLVGYKQSGTIANCFSTGDAVSTDFSGGNSNAGGLVGEFWSGTITNSYSTGSATASASTIISNGTVAGGLVGRQYGDGSKIEECYSVGGAGVTGGGTAHGCVGGLVGWQTNGSVTACFWDTETSSQSDGVGNVAPGPAGVEGKSTAEMKVLATFIGTGWDFTNETTNGTNDSWRMCADGVDYPRLSWQLGGLGDFACPDGVGIEDMLAIATAWLGMSSQAGYSYACDANADGTVNMMDLAFMAASWVE